MWRSGVVLHDSWWWGMAFKTLSLMVMLNLVPSNKAKLTIMREKGERLLRSKSDRAELPQMD
jgi:hypothetical protein